MSGGLNILYLGPESGTCLDRANAFRRLGHTLTVIDPRKLLPCTPWVDRITWRLGGQWFSPLLTKRLANQIRGQTFDLCYVDNGEWISAGAVAMLKRQAKKVINYNIDDPTGPRDGLRYTAYKQAVPHYDLLAVMREQNVVEVKRLGARHVMRVFMSADEISHAPRPITAEDEAQWHSEVLFLGTWMPERGPFLLELIQRGVPLTIRGGNWQKAPEWAQLKPYWKGGPISGDDYAKAIQCAKVNIGMLSKGNRDEHTTRSLEVPSLGGLLCAERTREHTAMYAESTEALFWQNAKECAELCKAALADPAWAQGIAQRGRQRYLANGHKNEHTLAQVLTAALST
jgi:spore maturation protein CgeB